MLPPPDIHETTQRLVRVLEALALPYALGGALGMGFAGVMRATRDIDVLVSLPALRSQELADALNQAGFIIRDRENEIPVDVSRITREAREAGHFRIWRGNVRVELFVPKVPLQDSILSRRIRVDLGEFSLWTTTPEDLILLKMIFHRPKDIEDVRRLLAVNRDDLDVTYIRNWIDRTLETGPGKELIQMMQQPGLPGG